MTDHPFSQLETPILQSKMPSNFCSGGGGGEVASRCEVLATVVVAGGNVVVVSSNVVVVGGKVVVVGGSVGGSVEALVGVVPGRVLASVVVESAVMRPFASNSRSPPLVSSSLSPRGGSPPMDGRSPGPGMTATGGANVIITDGGANVTSAVVVGRGSVPTDVGAAGRRVDDAVAVKVWVDDLKINRGADSRASAATGVGGSGGAASGLPSGARGGGEVEAGAGVALGSSSVVS